MISIPLFIALKIAAQESLPQNRSPSSRAVVINEQAAINFIESRLTVALWEAIGLRQNERIFDLLKDGANPNTKTPMGTSALHMAAQFGDVYIGQMLLDHGADIFELTDGGMTAGDLAIKSGNNDFYQMLENFQKMPARNLTQ